ncbi:hypothetical protein IJT93_13445 [bacterium]|nr:hypothetical protein [bacterium]
MDISLALAEAAAAASLQLIRSEYADKSPVCRTSDGLFLEAILKSRSENGRPNKPAAAETDNLFLGRNDKAPKVKLVASVRSRIRRAAESLSWELPLARRFAVASGFALLVGAAWGLVNPAPAQAENLPAALTVRSSCDTDNMVAATVVTPTNQALRYGRMYKLMGEASHTNVKGGVHTNVLSGHGNHFNRDMDSGPGNVGHVDSNGNPTDPKP